MTRLTASIVLLGALLGCQKSTFTQASTLQVKDVSPQHVTARGGTKVVITGSGFQKGMHVFVRGAEATVTAASSTSLTIESPTLIAGPASLDVDAGSQKAHVDNALVVDPIPLAFTEVPSWALPTLPGPVTALVKLPGSAAIAAGTSAGLFTLAWGSSAKLEATPISFAPPPDMDAGMAPTEPAVAALAVDPDAALLAACVADEANPIRLVDLSGDTPAVKMDAIQQPAACTQLAFVQVNPSGPRWLVAQTSNGLVAWESDGQQFTPRKEPLPMLPGALTAMKTANLAGNELLLLAGTNGANAWARTLLISALPMSTPDFLDEPLPAPAAAINAFATFDANQDGVTDVYAAQAGQDALDIGDGHGRYFDDAWQLLPFERSTGKAVALADFDLDGRTDIMVGTEDGPDRLFIAGTPAYLDQTPVLGLEGPFGTEFAVALDIDGDGDQDLLTAGSFTGGLRLRLLVEPTP